MAKGNEVLFCLQMGLTDPLYFIPAIPGQFDMKIRLKKTEYKDGLDQPELFTIIITIRDIPHNEREIELMKSAFFVSAPINFKIKEKDKYLYASFPQSGHILYYEQFSPTVGDCFNKFLIRGRLKRGENNARF
jgi:hypothetical protein